MSTTEERISLCYEDYGGEDEKLIATKDMMNTTFNEASFPDPIATVNINVYGPNVSIKDSSLLSQLVMIVTDLLNSNSKFYDIEFIPKGCEWKAVIDKESSQDVYMCSIEGIAVNFWIHAVVVDKGNGTGLEQLYSIELCLMQPTETTAFQHTAKILAKSLFETFGFQLQSKMSRLELPDFPHGNSGGQLRSFYQLNEKVGSGSFGTVFQGRHRETDELCAVKVVKKKKLSLADDAGVIAEVALLANIDHPNIVKIIDFFEEDNYYLIVMEYFGGGDLFDRIGSKESYTEEDARICSRVILKAINYLHINHVVHRDLKAKNLCLTSFDDDTNLKLIDFGFAKRVFDTNRLSRRCGTPYYIAPEVILPSNYGKPADMWSTGVILYLMFCGRMPFNGRNFNMLFRNVLKGKVTFEGSVWANVSEEAKDLISKLLDINPNTRYSAERALAHPWFKMSSDDLNNSDLSSALPEIRHFNARRKLKSAMLVVALSTKMSNYLKLKEENDDESNYIEDEDVDTDLQ